MIPADISSYRKTSVPAHKNFEVNNPEEALNKFCISYSLRHSQRFLSILQRLLSNSTTVEHGQVIPEFLESLQMALSGVYAMNESGTKLSEINPIENNNPPKKLNRYPRNPLFLFSRVGSFRKSGITNPCIYINGNNIIDYHIIHQQKLSVFMVDGKITISYPKENDVFATNYMECLDLLTYDQEKPTIHLFSPELPNKGFPARTPITVRVDHDEILIYRSDLADQMPLVELSNCSDNAPKVRQITVKHQDNNSLNPRFYPMFQFGGKYLEESGFHIGKKVNVHLEPNKITMTLADPLEP